MISKSFKICNSLLGSGSVQLETNPGRKGKVSKIDRAALGTKCDPLPGETRITPFRARKEEPMGLPQVPSLKKGLGQGQREG